MLGLKILENQDAISARVKGEILDHEIDTYKSLGVETLVVRTKENNIVDYENFEDFSVISGGFGNSSHPTQALIDISTLIKFDKLSYEIPITYVGDLKHSRVFSSGRELLTKLGYKIGVLTNKDLLPDNLDNLHIFNSWEEVIKYSGSVELLRIQKERLKNLDGFDFEDFIKNFQLNNEILESAKKDFIVMHPMPINIGIEIDKEALKNNRFIYKEQLKLATKTRVLVISLHMEKYDKSSNFIDLHTHTRFPDKNNFPTSEINQAAKYGGYSEILAMANSEIPIDSIENLEIARVWIKI